MRSIVVAGVLASFLQAQAPAPSALRIVVLEGEGAVNIIQLKTAVRPLVEIRDRNNVPVAGATVTFTIGGGGSPAAFAGGVQTLTVTTNAAGQAAASGLNALSSGAFQIQVQAAHQGQIATAAISQTNFATAAAASQAGAASGAGGGTGGSSGAAGGAAGGGGGMSGTTIGIVGAAVAGGAVAATQVTGDRDRGGGQTSSSSSGTTYSGSFSGQMTVTMTVTSNITSTCVSTRSLNGTLRITLRDGNASGQAEMRGSRQDVVVSGTCTGAPSNSITINRDVTGGPTNLQFLFESSATGPTPEGTGSVTVTETTRFTGSLSGNTITGTLGFEQIGRGNDVVGNVSSTIASSGQTSIQVTLTR